MVMVSALPPPPQLTNKDEMIFEKLKLSGADVDGQIKFISASQSSWGYNAGKAIDGNRSGKLTSDGLCRLISNLTIRK